MRRDLRGIFDHSFKMTFFKKMSKFLGIPLDVREFLGIIPAVYLFEIGIFGLLWQSLKENTATPEPVLAVLTITKHPSSGQTAPNAVPPCRHTSSAPNADTIWDGKS